MICPNCKNEKWDSDLCPKCGLREKEAFLSAAELFRKDGKLKLAIEAYDKYLQLEPDRFEIKCQKAGCLCSEAITNADTVLFERAGEYLRELLEKNWDWEMGHQYRIDLFYHFGKLGELLTEYRETASKNESRKNACDKLVQIIQLTDQFKNNPPAVYTDLDSLESPALWLKSFWPLIFGIPVFLGAAYEISTLFHDRGANGLLLFFVFLVFCSCIVTMFFISMKIYKQNKKRKKIDKAG